MVMNGEVRTNHITTVTFFKTCADVGTTDTAPSGPDESLKNILYIITGLVAGVVVLIIVIVVVYHWKVLAGVLRRRRSDSEE